MPAFVAARLKTAESKGFGGKQAALFTRVSKESAKGKRAEKKPEKKHRAKTDGMKMLSDLA